MYIIKLLQRNVTCNDCFNWVKLRYNLTAILETQIRDVIYLLFRHRRYFSNILYYQQVFFFSSTITNKYTSPFITNIKISVLQL